MMEASVPSFPTYITLPACGATLLLLIYHAVRIRDPYVTFLFLAVWFRYSIATFHQYTYPPIVAGLSLIALTSIGVTVIGLSVIGARDLLLRRLTPIYGLILVVLISAAANQAWVGAINTSFKWLYVVVFSVAAYRALQRHGSDRVFRALATVFAAPIALQWLSVPWGLKTINEDGSSSFIGGYQHQQALSIILLTFLYVTCFTPRLGALASYARLAIVAVGLSLANYRTALLSAALPAASLAISKVVRKFVPGQGTIIFVCLSLVAAFAFTGIAIVAQERFADLGTMVDKGASLIQPPEDFTGFEKRLFSGRVYLWSLYIDSYLRGDVVNRLIGFGPDSWVGRFPLYAHNTYISYLYECGVFGVAAFVWLLFANLFIALGVKGEDRLMLVLCHVGFIVLNMATMAVWTLEGGILYALLLGQTWYRRSAAVARNPSAMPLTSRLLPDYRLAGPLRR
jgi:O-Antigen ligase